MTVPMTELPGLDLPTLRRYLDRAVPGLVTGDLSGEVIAGGRSNLTYVVTDGTDRWVVRRPPLGHVLATAHDMGREYRVLTALFPTGYPVPETITLATDPDVIGAPFYVMRFVEGTVHREPSSLAGLVPSLIFDLVDRLADLHAVDPDAVGLGDFGRPAGYNERQVRRWKKQLDLSRSRSVEDLDELHERLAAAPPPVRQGTIVHGDYRIDNAIADGTRIVGVLDWEMSTVGDPLSDVALLLLYTSDRTLSVPGHPSLDDMVERYATRSGRDVSDLSWYRAMAAFKLAVISEGIHYRFTQGLTVGDGFDRVGERVAPLAAQGHDFLGGTDGLRL
ncbi:phosphotransferase family protein [Virgisporangium ochraceum]|uniref:Acyl-CoA dehydrogenase n=2 Tax=Virgisporangium ochraceum TaxID=65505 RepID=A0A8J3ZP84_9ACTN|nr:acyl-CoA dehydrogenase [Virgisporangium ochraceum]